MPSALPKTKSESLSDGNSVKSDVEEVLEVVPPTEPVLPFFSLPDAPTITTATKTSSIIRNGNGYQSTGKGYQSTNNGYQSSGYSYQINNNGYQGNNICQGVAKNLFVGDSRGDSVVAPTAAISCFVGDQRQSNDKNLRRCGGGNPSVAADVAREFVFPAAETVTDENRSHHEQASE